MFDFRDKKINYRAGLFLFLPWLGIILIFALVIFPRWQTYDWLKKQIEEKTPIIKSDYMEAMGLKKITEQENSEILGQKRRFADAGDNLVFITALENLASSTSVKVELNFSSPASDNSRYQILPLSINAIGNYANLLNYLKGLENFEYYITISSFNLSKKAPDKAQGDNSYNLSLIAKSYWRK